MDSRGERDAAYIRKVIKVQRYLEMGSRAVLLFSDVKVKGVRPAWWLGTAGLSVAKILENMEIGHNVMHGQWDWMRDPKIHSTAWEWDNASPAEPVEAQPQRDPPHASPTCSAATTTSATASCASTRTSAGACSTSSSRSGTSATPCSSSTPSRRTTSSSAATSPRRSEKEKTKFRERRQEVVGKIKRQATKDYLCTRPCRPATGSGSPAPP